MKITCPTCGYVIDAGDFPDTLLSVIGVLSVRCPRCASEIELAAVTATLGHAGGESTWRGTVALSQGVFRITSDDRTEAPEKAPSTRGWLDDWHADLTAQTKALGANALDYTDEPEDVARKANGQASIMAQRWADWRHDSEAEMIESMNRRRPPADRRIP